MTQTPRADRSSVISLNLTTGPAPAASLAAELSKTSVSAIQFFLISATGEGQGRGARHLASSADPGRLARFAVQLVEREPLNAKRRCPWGPAALPSLGLSLQPTLPMATFDGAVSSTLNFSEAIKEADAARAQLEKDGQPSVH
jgi:hypothetical protein